MSRAEYLSRRITDLPIALVVATRPPAKNSGPPAQLSDSRHATRDEPGEPAPEVVAALHDASGGNPFLATVLLDELDTLGLPLDQAATAEKIGGLGPSTVFRATLGRLPADAVRLARAAAVLGPGGNP
ncbi:MULTISPECIES: hypothetical protein [unclassified Saccharothrix]|uniref:hypothetical protein n=1 Tax=unclassified Saccharothrix TaxID=2593673 RepID=UPI00307CE776